MCKSQIVTAATYYQEWDWTMQYKGTIDNLKICSTPKIATTMFLDILFTYLRGVDR